MMELIVHLSVLEANIVSKETVRIIVSEVSTFSEVKRRIFEIRGHPIHVQSLSFEGTLHQDDIELSSVGIKDGSILQCTISLRSPNFAEKQFSFSDGSASALFCPLSISHATPSIGSFRISILVDMLPASLLLSALDLFESLWKISLNTTNPRILLRIVEDSLKNSLGYEFVQCKILDPRSKQLIWFQIPSNGSSEKEVHAPAGISMTGYVINSRMPLFSQDVYSDKRFHPEIDNILPSDRKSNGIRDLRIIPLVPSTGQVIGAIALANADFSVYGEEDLSWMNQYLELVAQHASTAFETVVRNQSFGAGISALKEESHRLKILLDVARAVTMELDTKLLIERILDESKNLMECDRCSLFLIDETNHELVAYHADGFADLRLPLGEGIVGLAASTGEVLNVKDAYEDRRFSRKLDEMSGYRTRSILCAPIRSHGQLIGVLQMINKLQQNHFSQEDEYFCTMLALFCGISLRNATLYEESLRQSDKSKLVLDLVENLQKGFAAEPDFKELLQTVAIQASEIAHAERCTIFLYKEDTGTLVSFVAQGCDFPLEISINDGIAGYCFKTQEIVNLANARKDPRFDSAIDSITGFQTNSLLCMPIKDVQTGSSIGVVQILNSRRNSFASGEVELLQALSSLCSLTFYNAGVANKARISARQVEGLLSAALSLSQGGSDTLIVRDVMEQARAVVEAERFSLFILDEETQMLRSKVAYGTEEILVSLVDGIAGYVVRTGEEVIANDPYSHPYFSDAVDRENGFQTKSLLALPVRDTANKVVGVVEVINKQNGPFSQVDVDVIRAFTSFCGHVVRPQPMLALYHHEPQAFEASCPIDPSERAALFSWNFAVWSYSDSKLIRMAALMFEELGLSDRFRIQKETLLHFLFTVQRFYQQHVPYHNFRHAIDVTQALFIMIREGHLDKYLTEVDFLVMLVGGLTHDLNHQGYNNVYMRERSTPFAMLNNDSVMESHHAALAVAILSSPRCNILAGMDDHEVKEFWKSLIDLILATDMSKHADWLKRFDVIVADPSSYSKDDIEKRRTLLGIIMKAADINNIARPTEIAHRWAEVLLVEFFSQGDAERRDGLQVTPLFDREKTTLAGSQVGFLRFVGISLFSKISSFISDLLWLSDQLNRNLNYWEMKKAVDESQPKENNLENNAKEQISLTGSSGGAPVRA